MHTIKTLPNSFKRFLIDLAELGLFARDFVRRLFLYKTDLNEIIRQCYRLGLNSLFLVGLTAFIIGIVMTIQMIPTMRSLGVVSWLPSTIAVSIIREIGPVLAALITAGKVASSIGSELGSMKVTEQIDAMTVSGVDPFNYLVLTRVLACIFMMPLLIFYADAIALFGSFLALNMHEEYSLLFYIKQGLDLILWIDVISSIIKSVLFGFAIGIISCFRGFSTTGGTAGVGKAANTAVVTSSLAIFIIDLITVQVTSFFMPGP